MIRLVVISVLLLGILPLKAQEWRSLFQESQEHLAQEEYDLALSKAERCLSDYMANDGETNANYAAILRSLVTINFMVENFGKSVEYGEKEVQVRKAIGENSGEVFATTLFNLGSAYQMVDDFNNSISNLESSYKLFAEILPSNDYELIRV